MYPAGFNAPTAEVAQLAEEAGKFGGLYATHLRDEAEKLIPSIEEAAEIGRAGGVAVVLSHHKVTGKHNWGGTKMSLKRIEQLAEGQTIHFDVYPYIASATALMIDRISVAEKVLIVASDKHPRTAGWYLKDIAEEWGMTEVQAAEELLPAQAIYFAMHEDDVRRVLMHPRAMVGSDGIPGTDAPHPRLWGTFPRVLGYYARQEGLFPLEAAVHKMTGHTAGVFGFKDRGVLRAGAYADITVFDPETILDRATFEKPTTPSDGITHVLVGGDLILENGRQTAARPGRLVSREGVL
jgi:N-acyl-D-amino-acid deacylase